MSSSELHPLTELKLRVLVADKLYSGVGEGAPLRGVSPDMWIKTTGLHVHRRDQYD